jgi:chromate transporter
MVEAPGTAPGSEWFIATAIYRHSRQAGEANIGANGPKRKSRRRQSCRRGCAISALRGFGDIGRHDKHCGPTIDHARRERPAMPKSDFTRSPASTAEPDAPSAVALAPTPQPAIAELFFAFASISISSFGGALAWARRMLVENKGWITAREFNDLLALCQFLPGPNIVNLCAVFGVRMRGIPGALACLVGLLGPSVVLMIAAGTLYRRVGALPELHGVLSGLAAAAAGVIIATAIKLAEPLVRVRLGPGHAVAIATFVAIGVLRLSLPLVLLVMVPVSIGFAWRRADEK